MSRGLLVGLGLLSTVVVACQPTAYYTPSLTGVVTSLTLAPGSNTVRDYVLQGGQTVRVDLATYKSSDVDPPEKGDLLLMGDDPVRWIARAPLFQIKELPQPCYVADGTGRVLDDAIEFDWLSTSGPHHLRFPTLAGFQNRSGPSAPGSELVGTTLCLDEHGRATSYG